MTGCSLFVHKLISCFCIITKSNSFVSFFLLFLQFTSIYLCKWPWMYYDCNARCLKTKIELKMWIYATVTTKPIPLALRDSTTLNWDTSVSYEICKSEVKIKTLFIVVLVWIVKGCFCCSFSQHHWFFFSFSSEFLWDVSGGIYWILVLFILFLKLLLMDFWNLLRERERW